MAMIFIRRHIHDASQIEYLTEEDACALWLALANYFDHKKDICLFKARHEWQHLRFKSLKSVNECNSEVCRIRSLLKFCNEDLTKEDLLENTYLTFNATNIVLQQQYKEQKFTKFSDLISGLLLAKKSNQLLIKNHQARPTGFNAMSEAHTINTGSHKQQKKRRGHGNGKKSQPRAQVQQNRGPAKGGNSTQKRNSLTPKASNFKNKGT
ncbi:uncharacterized protein [Pyrus communis]|uniref:uncharacterized protein n=1 Tax=Pyrus communis TaxID=23211 RepID=UPI0035BEB772